MRPLVSPSIQNHFVSQNYRNFTHFKTNTRHVCTYLNAVLMVIPNIVNKFQNIEFFEILWLFFNMSSAHACRVESINIINEVILGDEIKLVLYHAFGISIWWCALSRPGNDRKHLLLSTNEMFWMYSISQVDIYILDPPCHLWRMIQEGYLHRSQFCMCFATSGDI